MTKEQKAEYLKSPYHCPFCGSQKIESQDLIDVEENQAWQNLACLKCKKQWKDIYTLTDVGDCDD